MGKIARLSATTEARLQELLLFSEELPGHFEAMRELEEKLMATFDALTEAVKRNTDVTRGALTLIQGLASKIKECNYDPAALDVVVSDLEKSTAELADAVAVNTVADAPPASEAEVSQPADPAPEVLPPDQAPAEPSQ